MNPESSAPSPDFEEDYNFLLTWAKLPGKPYFKFLGIAIYNVFHPISLMEMNHGSLVNVSMMIQNVEWSINKDELTTEELKQERAEHNKELVDQFASCVGTCGVIGALVFSGLCSTILNPLNPSQDTTDYFSDEIVRRMSYCYYFFSYLAFLLSCYVVVISFLLFLAVNIWMPNRDLRSWYVRKGSAIVRLLFAAGGTIVFTFIGGLFAICVNVGPGPALIFLSLVSIALIVGFVEFTHMAAIASITMHRFCRQQLFQLEPVKEEKQIKPRTNETNIDRAKVVPIDSREEK